MSESVQDYAGPRRILQVMDGVVWNATLIRSSTEFRVQDQASKISLMVDITKNGSPTSLTFDLEVSLDGGATWFTPTTSWEYLDAAIPAKEWNDFVDLASPRFRITGTSVGTDGAGNDYTADVFVSVL